MKSTIAAWEGARRLRRLSLVFVVAVVVSISSGARAESGEIAEIRLELVGENEHLVRGGEPAELFDQLQWLPSSKVTEMAFGPGGLTLVAGTDDGSVRQWSVINGRELRRLPPPGTSGSAIQALAISPDGRWLATSQRDRPGGWLWDLGPPRRGHQPEPLPMEGEHLIVSLVFSRDQGEMNRLAAGTVAGQVLLWDIPSDGAPRGIPIANREGNGPISKIAFCRNSGRLIAGEKSAASDSTSIHLWETDFSLVKRAKTKGPDIKRALTSLDCLLDSENRVLAAAASKSRGVLWTPLEPDRDDVLPELGGAFKSVRFTPDGLTAVAVSSQGTVILRDVIRRETVGRVENAFDVEQLVVLSDDCRMMATVRDDDAIEIRATTEERVRQILRVRGDGIADLAFRPGSAELAVGTRSGALILWDQTEPEQFRRSSHLDSPLRSLFFVPTSSRELITVHADGKARQWDLRAFALKEKVITSPDEAGISAMALSPDGVMKVVGTDRGSLHLAGSAGGSSQEIATESLAEIVSVEFSPEGDLLAWRSADGKGNSSEDWSSSQELPPQPFGRDLTALTVLKSGRLITGDGSGELVIWRSGQAIQKGWKVSAEPAASIRALGVGPKGRRLVTSSDDGVIRLWDLTSRRELFRFEGKRLRDAPTSIAVSDDGEHLALGNSEGQVEVWRLDEKRPPSYHAGLSLCGESCWLLWLPDGRVVRHDLGTAILQATEKGRLSPIIPRQPQAPAKIKLEAIKSVPPADEIPQDEQQRKGYVSLRLFNDISAGPAYWVSVKTSNLPSEILPLSQPASILRLEPGTSKEITLDLLWNGEIGAMSSSPEESATSDPSRLRWSPEYHVFHAHGAGPTETQALSVMTPFFSCTEPQFQSESILQCTLKNGGNLTARSVRFQPSFGVVSDRNQPVQNLENLAQQESRKISFTIPEDTQDQEDFEVKLMVSWNTPWVRHQEIVISDIRPSWIQRLTPWHIAVFFVLIASLVGFLTYITWVFTNTTYKRVFRDPESLIEYRLSQFPNVERALTRARRLDVVLAEADISRNRWNRAVAASRSPDDAAAIFAETVQARLGDRIADLSLPTWAIQLPQLSTRFVRDTVLVVVMDESQEITEPEGEVLAKRISEASGDAEEILILDMCSNGAVSRIQSSQAESTFVTLSDEQLKSLIFADRPVELLGQFLDETKQLRLTIQFFRSSYYRILEQYQTDLLVEPKGREERRQHGRSAVLLRSQMPNVAEITEVFENALKGGGRELWSDSERVAAMDTSGSSPSPGSAASQRPFFYIGPSLDMLPRMAAGDFESRGLVLIPLHIDKIQEAVDSDKERELLTAELDAHLGRADPFSWTQPVSAPSEFFGRQTARAALLQDMNKGQPAGIFGIRKIGKTSLLQHVLYTRPGPTIYIDCQTLPESPNAGEIALMRFPEELRSSLERLLPPSLQDQIPRYQISRRPSRAEIIEAVRKYLSECHRLYQKSRSNAGEKPTPITVVIDEVDRLVGQAQLSKDGMSSFEALFGLIRGMSQSTDRIVECVVAGFSAGITQQDRSLSGGLAGNPVYAYFKSHYLGPLDRDELKEMMNGLGSRVRLQFNDSAISQLWKWTGGHPMLARSIGSIVLRDQRELELPQNTFDTGGIVLEAGERAVEMAAQRLLDDPKENYAISGILDRYDDPCCREVLNGLARAGEGGIKREALADLGGDRTVAEGFIDDLQRVGMTQQDEAYHQLFAWLLVEWLRRQM